MEWVWEGKGLAGFRIIWQFMGRTGGTSPSEFLIFHFVSRSGVDVGCGLARSALKEETEEEEKNCSSCRALTIRAEISLLWDANLVPNTVNLELHSVDRHGICKSLNRAGHHFQLVTRIRRSKNENNELRI